LSLCIILRCDAWRRRRALCSAMLVIVMVDAVGARPSLSPFQDVPIFTDQYPFQPIYSRGIRPLCIRYRELKALVLVRYKGTSMHMYTPIPVPTVTLAASSRYPLQLADCAGSAYKSVPGLHQNYPKVVVIDGVSTVPESATCSGKCLLDPLSLSSCHRYLAKVL
jgi:hypothetical protein